MNKGLLVLGILTTLSSPIIATWYYTRTYDTLTGKTISYDLPLLPYAFIIGIFGLVFIALGLTLKENKKVNQNE